MQLTKNFSLSEFACNDGTPVPPELVPNVQHLANNLQVIRDEIGEPIIILSGYRTVSWNDHVGGADKSCHLTAEASDLVTKGLTPDALHQVILRLIREGKIEEGGVGIYNSFVHYDVRGHRARWHGRK